MSKIGFCMIALSLAACESKPAPDPAKPTTVAAEPVEPAPSPREPAADEEPDYASFKAADWCPAAHTDTVKIVTAIKATMKQAGVAEKQDEYKVPQTPRYLELCSKLPLPLQKCLVVSYSARNRDACQSAVDGLDGEAKAAYAELMGK